MNRLPRRERVSHAGSESTGISLLSLGAISDFDLDRPRDLRSFRFGLVAELRGLLLLGTAVQCNALYTAASERALALAAELRSISEEYK
jgi:hypothetical protein